MVWVIMVMVWLMGMLELLVSVKLCVNWVSVVLSMMLLVIGRCSLKWF